MRETIIGLTGLAGSGKSTVANYLVEQHGFTKLAFAGPLKKMLRTLNPYLAASPVAMVGEDEPLRLNDLLSVMDENALKKSSAGAEYRRLMQILGTECIRAIDPDFWTKAAIAQMPEEQGRYVFDDVRFPNEAQVILELNPHGLWNIQRSDQTETGSHISEQYAGNMNESVRIENGDLAELYPQIEYYLSIHV